MGFDLLARLRWGNIARAAAILVAAAAVAAWPRLAPAPPRVPDAVPRPVEGDMGERSGVASPRGEGRQVERRRVVPPRGERRQVRRRGRLPRVAKSRRRPALLYQDDSQAGQRPLPAQPPPPPPAQPAPLDPAEREFSFELSR